MKKLFKVENIVAFISILFLAWIFISWLEVVTHNAPHQPEYTYSAINFFKIICGGV
jgi:hypothetical protein